MMKTEMLIINSMGDMKLQMGAFYQKKMLQPMSFFYTARCGSKKLEDLNS